MLKIKLKLNKYTNILKDLKHNNICIRCNQSEIL